MPAYAGLLNQQGDLQTRQVFEVFQQLLADFEAHADPANDLWRTDGHGNDLVGLAVNQLNLMGLMLAVGMALLGKGLHRLQHAI